MCFLGSRLGVVAEVINDFVAISKLFTRHYLVKKLITSERPVDDVTAAMWVASEAIQSRGFAQIFTILSICPHSLTRDEIEESLRPTHAKQGRIERRVLS